MRVEDGHLHGRVVEELGEALGAGLAHLARHRQQATARARDRGQGRGATPVALKATAKSSFLTTIFTFPYLLVIYGAISSLFFSRPLICRASAV